MLISVNASRHEGDWVMRFHLDGMHTVRARHWKDTRAKTAEAVSSMSGIPLADIELEFSFADVALHRAYHRLTMAARALDDAHSEHNAALRDAANAFCAVAPVRDAGGALGYSHAYIARIAKGEL